MQSESKFLDDLQKLASGMIGSLHGLKEEIEQLVRQRVERLIADMDLVTREEFEAVKKMAANAREENEALKKQLDAMQRGGKSTKPASGQGTKKSKKPGGGAKAKSSGKSSGKKS